MRIKNAFKILISHSVMIYKTLFFKLITSSLVALLAYFVITKDISFIFSQTEISEFWNSIITTFSEFLKGNPFNKELIPSAFDKVLLMLKANASTIFIAFFKVGVFVFLLNIISRMGNYAVGLIANGYMSSLSKYSLMASLIANIGRAFLYSIVIVPITLLIDFAVIALAILMGVYGVRVISVFAIIISLMFVVLAISCKFTIFSKLMPAMLVDKKSLKDAFKSTFAKRDKFFQMVGNYAFVIMISFYLNVSVAVFTVGAGLIVSIPLTSIFTILVSLVDYYQIQGKKYYVSSDQVVVPRQMHEHAQFLKYM